MGLLKNVPSWERMLRIGAGIGLGVLGVVLIADTLLVLGIVFTASGAGLAVTGMIGWCPACAMVGRKLAKPERVIGVQKLKLHD